MEQVFADPSISSDLYATFFSSLGSQTTLLVVIKVKIISAEKK